MRPRLACTRRSRTTWSTRSAGPTLRPLQRDGHRAGTARRRRAAARADRGRQDRGGRLPGAVPGWPPRAGPACRSSTCARSRRCSTTCCRGWRSTAPGPAAGSRSGTATPPAPARKAILADPPDLLLTTPESLESMLVSASVDHQRLFAGLRAVIVDEVHAFGGGRPRLAPARRAGTADPDRRAARSSGSGCRRPSATRTSCCAGCRDRRPGSDRAPSSRREPGRRCAGLGPFDGSAGPAPASGPDIQLDYVGIVANAAKVIAALYRGEKRLVFCDSKRLVEELGARAAGARRHHAPGRTRRCRWTSGGGPSRRSPRAATA